MALADIIQLVSFEKDAKIARMKESQEKDIKILLEEATARGEKYSIQKFEEFEIFQKALEKRTDSDIVRNEKIKTAEFIKKISEEVFFALKKEIMSLSEKDQITFFANEIAKISDTKGDILARGTSVSVLEKAVKNANKDFLVIDGKGNGGFIFKGNGFTSDFTISSLIDGGFKDRNEADLVENLFT